MWMDGTYTVMDSILIFVSYLPFPKKIALHTPVVFISPTSAEKLLLEIFAARAGEG